MKQPDAFTRAGSDDEFNRPVLGAFTKVGNPTYSACKYGNGINGSGSSNRWKYTLSNRGTWSMTFWLKPKYAYNSGSLSVPIYNWDTESAFTILLTYGASLIQFTCSDGGSNSNIYRFTPYYNWAVNDLIHFGFTSNPTASAGNKMKGYMNGNLMSVSSYSEGGTGNPGTSSIVIDTGYNDAGPLDNWKIWSGHVLTQDEIKMTMSERGGMNDLVGVS